MLIEPFSPNLRVSVEAIDTHLEVTILEFGSLFVALPLLHFRHTLPDPSMLH